MFVEYFFNEIFIILPIIFTGQRSCLYCRHIVHSFSCLIATCIPGFFHKSDFRNSEQFSPAANYTISKVAVAPTRRLSLITENRSLLVRNSVDAWLLTVHTGPDWRAGELGQLPGAPSYEGCWDIMGIIVNVVLIKTWKNVSVNYPQFWHAPSEMFASPVLGQKCLKFITFKRCQAVNY
jgi:hypothetical protein